MIHGNPNPHRNEPLPVGAANIGAVAAGGGKGSGAAGKGGVERRKPLPQAMHTTLRERMNGLALSPPGPPHSPTTPSPASAGPKQNRF